MAYDERLAERIRPLLHGHTVREQKMFGGLAFMVNNKMACGIVGDVLMVRVGSEGYDDALAKPHARPMDFTGRPSRGMVYVDPPGIRTTSQLATWVRRGVEFVAA